MSRRKELTLLCETIGTFHKDYYKPMLDKLVYHHFHLKMLSKSHCGNLRKQAVLKRPGDVVARRDYAERLSGKMNHEIQSSHFGGGISLSIEGCNVEYSQGEKTVTEFHSHLADKSPQDSTSTYAHMEVLIEDLLKRNVMEGGKSTMWDYTDGCAKQYRCAKALWLMSVQCTRHCIVIDRSVDAPGHGRGIVDGRSAITKNFLREKMRTICIPEDDEQNDKMNAHTMMGDSSQSFAKEAIRLLSVDSRKIRCIWL